MINSYFRKNIEAKLADGYVAIADAVRNKQLLDPLKDNTAIYKAMDVDPNWTITTGLCLDDIGGNTFIKGELSSWTLEVQCRHKTNKDYFVDIQVNSIFSNTGFWTSDSKPKADVTNMETHLDYELISSFVDKLNVALPDIDFADGVILFKKNDPE